MVKVKYNTRKTTPRRGGTTLIEHVRKFPTFKLAIEFVRAELRSDETVVGKPLVEGNDE